MATIDDAVRTQLDNLQKRSGLTLAALHAKLRASGLAKHGELRDWLKRELAMGHGDANLVVTLFLAAPAAASTSPTSAGGADAAVLDAIYAGPKAAMRPIHDKLMAAIERFGAFEVAPKKTYVSLRRKKQFAMIGPATNTRFEVGLNLKGASATARLKALPPGGMCPFKVELADVKSVDAELLGWIRAAYDQAG